jgi:uncharacterized protein YbjQ (UPF0145 family)
MPTSLPPTGRRRLDRAAASDLRTSLLSAPAAVALDTVGFHPVGEVMGCTVVALAPVYGGGCGNAGYSGSTPTVRLSGNRWSGYSSYLQALRAGYDTALRRLVDEARALGAHGVVGVDLRRSVLPLGRHEFYALGTAVRAGTAGTPPATPFTTDMAGTDVAALLLSGWVPVSLHVAVELGIRHDDLDTVAQATQLRRNRVNVEVSGWTELLRKVSASVRTKLGVRIAAAGADGGLLSGLTTSNWGAACGAASDHIVQAVASGTAVARFDHAASHRPAPLVILPLRDRGDTRR